VEQRERRRDLTYRAALRAQREHLQVVHPDGRPDCACERSPLYFRKRKSLGCDCRGRKHGNPKIGTGACHGGHRRLAVEQRVAWRQERHRWLRGLVDGDDLVASLSAEGSP
jgi:hypothetical protein